jgi:HEAT repeats
MLMRMTSLGDEQPGVDAVEVVIDMLELAQEEEGWWPDPGSYWPDPGPLTTATMEATLPALARLGHGWVGAARYERWFLTRGQYLAPGGPVAMLATRLYLALQPPHDKARKRELAVHGFQAAVRRGAVQAIAQSGDLAELAWLRTRVELDPEPLVRATAMQAVVTGEQGDGDLLGWLRDRATDQHADVRRAAVEAIATGWPDDPGTPGWLRARAFDPDETVRRAAVEAVAAEGAPEADTLAWIMARGRDLSPQVRLSALAVIATRQGDAQALTWLRARARDQDGDVRRAAVQAIATGWASDPQTLPWLLARAKTRPRSIPLLEPEDTYGSWAGPSDDVRVAAIQAIASGWSGDAAVLPSLRGWASDQHPAAREAAVAGLAAGWPDIFEAPAPTRRAGEGPTVVGPSGTLETAVSTDLALLRSLATDPGRKPRVRSTALRRLAFDWPDDEGTLALLQDVALDVPMYAPPEVSAVASSAIQLIAVGWPDHPGTRPLLHEVMVRHPDTSMSLTAARALVAGWPDDTETLSRLRDLATEKWSYSSEAFHIRVAAIALIATAYRNDPGSLPLLKELLNDGQAPAEVAAVRELAAGWHDDVSTPPLLREVVRAALGGSGSSDAGRVAIEELAVGWPDDPGTLTFLAECATDLRKPFTEVRSAVFRTLAVGWSNDPDVLSFLRERGLVQQDHERWTAAQAVIIARPDDLESFALLRSCMSDFAWDVRCDVLAAIAVAWPDHPGTPLVLLAATSEGHEWVEARALNAIAAGWPDHPQTLPQLRHRAEDTETKADTRMAALMAYVAVGPDDPQALAWLGRLTPEVQKASVDRHRTSQS